MFCGILTDRHKTNPLYNRMRKLDLIYLFFKWIYNIRGHIIWGEICRQLRLLILNSFIGQSVHPFERGKGSGWGYR